MRGSHVTESNPLRNINRTYALAMNFLDFGRFLAGCAREKSSNCVSPNQFSEKLLQIQSLEVLQILGLAI